MVKDEVGVMREEVGVVKDEVGVIREEVGVMREEVDVLKDEVGVMREEVGVVLSVRQPMPNVVGYWVYQKEMELMQNNTSHGTAMHCVAENCFLIT